MLFKNKKGRVGYDDVCISEGDVVGAGEVRSQVREGVVEQWRVVDLNLVCSCLGESSNALEGELVYMRARFERVVGTGGLELSIFLLRI